MLSKSYMSLTNNLSHDPDSLLLDQVFPGYWLQFLRIGPLSDDIFQDADIVDFDFNDVAGTLAGPQPVPDKKIELPPGTNNKSYQLELSFKNDARGAVSVSAENVFLSTDQYFAARTAPLTSRIFEFVAIPTGQLEISLQWGDKNIITPMGKTFGVMIQDLHGTSIASKRWAVPVGTVFNTTGESMKRTVSKLIIPIPAEYQGKPVKIFTAAHKTTGWEFGKFEALPARPVTRVMLKRI